MHFMTVCFLLVPNTDALHWVVTYLQNTNYQELKKWLNYIYLFCALLCPYHHNFAEMSYFVNLKADWHQLLTFTTCETWLCESVSSGILLSTVHSSLWLILGDCWHLFFNFHSWLIHAMNFKVSQFPKLSCCFLTSHLGIWKVFLKNIGRKSAFSCSHEEPWLKSVFFFFWSQVH